MTKWKYKINIKQHLKPFEGVEDENITKEQFISVCKGVVNELRNLITILKEKEPLRDAFFNPVLSEEDIEAITDEFVFLYESSSDNVANLICDFNCQLEELYNWADKERVWLGM